MLRDKREPKRGCFAYSAKGCVALTKMVCTEGECPFYKTKPELKAEQEITNKRAKMLGYDIKGEKKERRCKK